MAIGFFITLIGDIGIEHGLSFPVYMRAPFGTIGTHIPSIIRGVTASCWFGINTYFGSTAMNGILNFLFGFDNWFVCFLIFAAFNLSIPHLGIKAIERFADLAAPIIIIISVWMYISLIRYKHCSKEEMFGLGLKVQLLVGCDYCIYGCYFCNMGFWATLAADIPSISRFIKAPKHEKNWFKRNKASIVGNLIAMPITQTFMVIIGAVSYIAVSEL